MKYGGIPLSWSSWPCLIVPGPLCQASGGNHGCQRQGNASQHPLLVGRRATWKPMEDVTKSQASRVKMCQGMSRHSSWFLPRKEMIGNEGRMTPRLLNWLVLFNPPSNWDDEPCWLPHFCDEWLTLQVSGPRSVHRNPYLKEASGWMIGLQFVWCHVADNRRSTGLQVKVLRYSI